MAEQSRLLLKLLHKKLIECMMLCAMSAWARSKCVVYLSIEKLAVIQYT